MGMQSKDVEAYAGKKLLEQEIKKEIELEKKNVFADFRKRLFRHKGAVIGVIIIFLFIFSAVFAPWLTSLAMTNRIYLLC